MDRYLASRSKLIATGAPGLHSARQLAMLTDDVLSRLAAESPRTPTGRWSLIQWTEGGEVVGGFTLEGIARQ